ncbi:heavy-metal-associated domain-containing protein [Candidatus Methylacidiphilum infernorum]|uniref:Lead, cadmium, zinc and mercury transporting ATPase n=1 Tax=Methylacidiphilum infernorum (isolate V4) TaxID=481448 RepID=B3DYY6_METI4|nr:heavy metal-associated domain-containing protein [Candidatus Methylacidiphilum infernorum]ACD82508.1 Lead, cadmium, zinc and mercury transporting ATPase [Methylacidiphilum infernorum V4]
MKSTRLGILSLILASSCCAGPLLLAALGLGAGSAFFGKFHWVFLIGGAVLLLWAWKRYWFEQKSCKCETKKEETHRSQLITLQLSTVFFLFFLAMNVFPYVFDLKGSEQSLPAAALSQGSLVAKIPIGGMSCASCELEISHSLKKIKGIKWVKVSFPSKEATVIYDPKEVEMARILSAIRESGYEPGSPRLFKQPVDAH